MDRPLWGHLSCHSNSVGLYVSVGGGGTYPLSLSLFLGMRLFSRRACWVMASWASEGGPRWHSGFFGLLPAHLAVPFFNSVDIDWCLFATGSPTFSGLSPEFGRYVASVGRAL
jgi:hypothetical protein